MSIPFEISCISNDVFSLDFLIVSSLSKDDVPIQTLFYRLFVVVWVQNNRFSLQDSLVRLLDAWFNLKDVDDHETTLIEESARHM